MKITFFFAALFLLDLFTCYHAYPQYPLPDIEDAKFIEDCLRAHNTFRSKVNPPASNMFRMSWDAALAKTAKAWAKKCKFKHNIYLKTQGKVHPTFTPVGENIWTGTATIFSVDAALSHWFNEVSSYDFNTNRCTSMCGHYTQVVWAESYKVGCAVHFCNTVENFPGLFRAAHFVCNYGPAGNYPRKPYKAGRPCSGCSNEKCIDKLCENTEREKQITGRPGLRIMLNRFSACVLALLHFCCSSVSYEPPTLPDVGDPKFIEECVQTHNRFRSGVNPPASNMLYMSWDPDLAKTAKAWAKKCLFKHNTYLKDPGQAHPKFTPVGENLWTGSHSMFTVQAAITSWYNEVSAYNYATNNCGKTCGHYTQVVWATSYKVGCAVHFCPRVEYSFITNAAHFICNYGPAGNYPVRPYKMGAACSDCNGEQCASQLCQNAERDKVISDSKWHPDWDRPACDEYCITIIALRPLLLILTILASWLVPKYWSLSIHQ
ncbi:glioma pathogenesis-related protein 1 [Aegotheles albertisi]